ncbi:hypothetical protein HanRHA438_Chr14g0678771 [Helianthus annuus]|nr:hypothetical protein HanRHA438_Chr14g0678771 [Helianthus annuus]
MYIYTLPGNFSRHQDIHNIHSVILFSAQHTFISNTHMNTMTMMMLTMIEVSPVSAVRISNKWYQSAWLENEELRSELSDPGDNRMKNKNRDIERGTKDEDMKGIEIEDHQNRGTSDVKMKKRRKQKRREQRGKKGYPELVTTVSDKRRKIATEQFSDTEVALTTVKRLSVTKWEMSNNITVHGITKQFMLDSWTHYDKFKEKVCYHRRRETVKNDDVSRQSRSQGDKREVVAGQMERNSSGGCVTKQEGMKKLQKKETFRRRTSSKSFGRSQQKYSQALSKTELSLGECVGILNLISLVYYVLSIIRIIKLMSICVGGNNYRRVTSVQ